MGLWKYSTGQWGSTSQTDLKAGWKACTVSTDDPPFFHTTMEREYALLAEAFDWDDGVFGVIARTSAEAAFCTEETRKKLLKILEKAHA